MDKYLYIISGCNGAGKTTASYTVLPDILDCREFVNADEIARGLSIETTLASRSYLNLVRKAQAKGYQVSILFFWLRTPELAIQRVAERVRNGGHNIPENTIRRRYISGIKNLFELFIPEVDYWAIYDNTEQPRKKVASGRKNLRTDIFNEESYKAMLSYV